MTIDKLQEAVHYCEQLLNVSFEGNINNKHQIIEFLNEYLEDAKILESELKCEYEAYVYDLIN